MRILSLGLPLPGPAIDNHTFFNAPSFFDYDALVVDPRSISQLIDDIVGGSVDHTSYAGERIVNGPAAHGAVSLAETLHNRADETARLLARGGIVVSLAVPNAVHEGIEAFPAFDRYSWLPAPLSLSYEAPFMKRGGGAAFGELDMDQPISAAIAQIKARLAYQVYFDDLAPEFTGKILARSTGGAAVAIELPISGGTIAFLPPPARALDSQSRYQVSDALQLALRQHLRLSSASAAPRWLSDYDLPGLAPLLAARDNASNHLTEAQHALTAHTAALDDLERYRGLLWKQGLSLEEAVRASLALLGFRVLPDQLDAPARVDLPGPALSRRTVLLETDSGEEAIGLDVHYRMRRRLEGALAEGAPQRGLVVINGYRRTPPVERPEQYAAELRLAAEQLRYALATTDQLYHAVCAALAGDEVTVERFRERLLTADGTLLGD